MKIERRLLAQFNWPLLLTVLLIALAGVVNLYSASRASMPGLYKMQLYWVLVGFVAAVAAAAVDYRHIERLAIPMYVAGIAALGAVLLGGHIASGSQRWLSLGPVKIQPSEFMKLAMIVMLAKYFHKDIKTGGYDLRELVVPLLLIAVPACLILPQPDLGSAAMLGLTAVSLLLFLGIRLKAMLVLGAGGVVAVLAGWFIVLAEYQKRRIASFLNPTEFAKDAAYHAIQSMIAIGSGGVWGKGFMGGTQSQLSFLPEQHTDFVFSVFAEEWGFAGGLLVVFGYIVMFGLIVSTASRSRDKMGALLCIGVAAMLFWHVFINIGMVIGILPVVGVPLPLMSYGGSTALTTFLGIGLVLNVSMRRFMF